MRKKEVARVSPSIKINFFFLGNVLFLGNVRGRVKRNVGKNRKTKYMGLLGFCF